MKVKPATLRQARSLEEAIEALRIARDKLAAADCPQALDATRRALKSAQGAERHMPRRLLPRDSDTGEPLRANPPRAMFIPKLAKHEAAEAEARATRAPDEVQP